MKKRALLLGCNYAHTDPAKELQLQGCINDVELFKGVLIQKFGFREEDITTLVDRCEGDTFPTAANIKHAITAVAEELTDGDILVVHYSGHGVQTESDKDNDEVTDGRDEALVTADARFITDDRLKRWIGGLHKGVKLTFIADCCHSGSMLDQPPQDVKVTGDTPAPWAAQAPPPLPADTAPVGEAVAKGGDITAVQDSAAEEGLSCAQEGGKQGGRDSPSNTRQSQQGAAPASCALPRSRSLTQSQVCDLIKRVHGTPDAFLEQDTDLPNTSHPKQWLARAVSATRAEAITLAEELPVAPPAATLPDHCTLLTGCMDDQRSADDLIGTQYHGAFTYSLVHAIISQEGNQTYREVIQAARGWLASQRDEGSEEQRYPQDPCLNCADHVVDAVFICEQVGKVGGSA